MDFVALPEWTEYRKKSGLDPLGMQASSVSFYQKLLSGIGNATIRIRYYGFYCWLTNQYSKHIRDTDPLSWQRILCRAEALYALTAAKAANGNGVAGITWASKRLEANTGSTIDFSVDTESGGDNRYLKQAWGAYGAAYGGQLFEIGLLTKSDDHDIPIPQVGLGDQLAGAFESMTGQIGGIFFNAVKKGSVSLLELDEFEVLLPSNIDVNGDERQLYEELLFACVENPTEKEIRRKYSLGLILKTAEQLKRRPSVHEIRWLAYSGYSTDEQALLIDNSELDAHVKHWWTYQANDLVHIIFETFLKYLLDILEEYPQGVTLHGLVSAGVGRLKAEIKVKPVDWAEYIALCIPEDNAANESDYSEKSLCEVIFRETGSKGICKADTALKALCMLAIIQNRVTKEKNSLTDSLSEIRDEPFRSLKTELDFLESSNKEEFWSVVSRLFLERTLRRHLWVATNKLRYQGDYTYLLEPDDGLVRLRGKDGPVFTNPRLSPAINFLEDIGLLDRSGITSAGIRVLDSL